MYSNAKTAYTVNDFSALILEYTFKHFYSKMANLYNLLALPSYYLNPIYFSHLILAIDTVEGGMLITQQ